ncbi:hypothetical protein [Desulfobacter curvatus]|uniref:hypothetical protein n=1 Tax=Desulfobacter curvatus TaxID=2290 RepID=UPI0012FBA199|nr:hypothetical protein [Desulfobacter curvatus]
MHIKTTLKSAFLEDDYIIPIDGTQYFQSESVNCPSYLEKKHRNGTVSYSHQALCAAVAHPDKRQVLPLAPEPIKNTDGSKKQDCEINAGKRILHSNGSPQAEPAGPNGK